MKRDRHLIITPNGLEKTVYSIYEQDLSHLLRITLLEIFSLKDIQSPKIRNFQSAVNSPIKIIKNKSNLHLQTSVEVLMNDILFECKTQMPCDLHKQSSWKPLCEDMLELNIQHQSLSEISLSVFAIKNAINNKHYYFADFKTIQKIKQLFFMLSCFLEENSLKKSFTHIYKKIMNDHDVDDILNSLKDKDCLTSNKVFLMTCISQYKQPNLLLASFLHNNILPKHWISGETFFEEFSNSITTSPEQIKDMMIHTYDKFLLYVNLNLQLTCQNKVKYVKI